MRVPQVERASPTPEWLAERTGRASVFNVRDFGARGDGATKDTGAVVRAVAAGAAAGSGTVYFPPGRYLVAPFNLTSHCTVYLDAKAGLLASTEPDDWPLIPALPSYGQGKKGGPLRRSSLIHGEHLVDVAHRRHGTIDGPAAAKKAAGGWTNGH